MSTRHRYRPWFKDPWCEGFDPVRYVYLENARIWIGEVTKLEAVAALEAGERKKEVATYSPLP
jgi:hypothetical protein